MPYDITGLERVNNNKFCCITYKPMPIFKNFSFYSAHSFMFNKQPQRAQGRIPENEDDLL